MRKFGVHLCFTNAVKALDVIQDAENTRDNLLGISALRQEDRPLIVQLFSEEPEILVKAVNGLEGLCDAVDISNNFTTDGLSDLPVDKQHDKWSSWLSCIQRVHQECKMPIMCKLPFNWQTTDEAVERGKSLHKVGCELLLLHKHSAEKINASISKKDWDSVKVIRESVSLPIIVDVGLSSKWEVDECIEYTGVQGVTASESLEGNPSLFCKKQPPVLDVVRQYLELCKVHPTSISNIKHHINGFCGFYLSRFHDLSTSLKEVQSLEGIEQLIEELGENISKLSGKELKSLTSLRRKKEWRKRGRDRKKGEGTKVVKERDENHIPKIVLKKLQKERVGNAMKSDAQRVAIDFTVIDCMLNKEISKLAGQLMRLYGCNMKSSSPVHLYLTGLETGGVVYRECERQSFDFTKILASVSEKTYLTLFDADDVVYLTPDSPNVLDQLNKDKVYIIGGLVDHQVRKDKTKSLAEEKGLCTARLPIDKYMELKDISPKKKKSGKHAFSIVLSVNQVFEILLKFHETQDWRQALGTCVPQRKGLVLKT